MMHGRCLELETLVTGARRVTLISESGTHSVEVFSGDEIKIGDIIEISDGRVKLLTPNRAPGAESKWVRQVLDPRRLRAIQIRTEVESGIAEFFCAQQFRQVRTPLLVPCPGMEPHIRPFRVEGGGYLPTSPEFAMKRLLVGGLERIFQICPSFRMEPYSNTHHPEFTMLEWYRAYAGFCDIMRDVENLFEFLAKKMRGNTTLHFAGRDIDVSTPWPRLKVRDLFWEHTQIDLIQSSGLESMREHCDRLKLKWAHTDTWDDLYFRIWLNLIEPCLPANRAVLVTHYPASQAALSVIETHEDGSRWARRFEVYAGGLELGNAFEELTDPIEQRRRFVEDMELRTRLYGDGFPPSPLDQEFLGALTEGMPPSAGIAMGVDRMVMIFADEPEISMTQWLPSYLE